MKSAVSAKLLSGESFEGGSYVIESRWGNLGIHSRNKKGEQVFVSLRFTWYNMVAVDIHSSRHSIFLMNYRIVWMQKYRKAFYMTKSEIHY